MRAFLGFLAIFVSYLNTTPAIANITEFPTFYPEFIAEQIKTENKKSISTFQVGLQEFETYKNKKIKSLSHKKHKPVLLQHGGRTEYVVILFHGLYESPRSLQGIAKEFHKKGMNVLMPVLPGHWQKNINITDKISYEHWLNEVDLNMKIAQKLGKKIIVAGFSLGGVLATVAALKYPSSIHGLFVWSPAYGLSAKVSLATSLGTILGINANEWDKLPVDGQNTPYYSLHMASQIFKLHTYVNSKYLGNNIDSGNPAKTNSLMGWDIAPKIKAPVFVVYSTEDEAISKFQVRKFFKYLKTKKSLIVFDDVKHTPTSKSRVDANPMRPNEYNPHFEMMMRHMSAFIDSSL